MIEGLDGVGWVCGRGFHALIVVAGRVPRHRGVRPIAITDSRDQRSTSAGSSEAVAERPGGGIRSAAGVDLAVDVGDVALDGVHADPERRGDLGVRVALGDVRRTSSSRGESAPGAAAVASRPPGDEARKVETPPRRAPPSSAPRRRSRSGQPRPRASSKNRLAVVPGQQLEAGVRQGGPGPREIAAGSTVASVPVEHQDRATDIGSSGRDVDRAAASRIVALAIAGVVAVRNHSAASWPPALDPASRATRAPPTRRRCPSRARSTSAAPGCPGRSSGPSHATSRRTGRGRDARAGCRAAHARASITE